MDFSWLVFSVVVGSSLALGMVAYFVNLFNEGKEEERLRREAARKAVLAENEERDVRRAHMEDRRRAMVAHVMAAEEKEVARVVMAKKVVAQALSREAEETWVNAIGYAARCTVAATSAHLQNLAAWSTYGSLAPVVDETVDYLETPYDTIIAKQSRTEIAWKRSESVVVETIVKKAVAEDKAKHSQQLLKMAEAVKKQMAALAKETTLAAIDPKGDMWQKWVRQVLESEADA